jgi:CheY-like chemotaxis protein
MALILVIDDEPIVRQLFAKVLQGDGHQVMSAANGREALSLMSERVPDVVLVDLLMPVMDGLSFLRVLRRRDDWKHLPVLMISGVLDRQLVIRAKQLGVSDYLLKTGFAMGDFRARLAKYLPEEFPCARADEPAAETEPEWSLPNELEPGVVEAGMNDDR